MKKSNNFATIIIPCLNEEDYLPVLLNDLAKQTRQDFQVIVVDGKSEDQTKIKALKYQDQLNLKFIEVDIRHVSYQRNFGAKQATTEWLIFMDADNRVPNFFMQGIKYKTEKNKHVDVFTCASNWDGYKGVDKMTIQVINQACNVLFNIKPGAFGALIGVKRKIFTKGFQFEENLSYGEDSSFVRDVAAAGYTYEYWQEPTYRYSTRRIKKEGPLRLFLIYLQGTLHQEGDFDKYPMKGGKYYLEKRKTLLEHLDRLLAKGRSQLKQSELRKFLEELKSLTK